jgi:hypothetical protein
MRRGEAMRRTEVVEDVTEQAPRPSRVPLYCRLLRLRHLHPTPWQRAVLGEGTALTGAVLALADLASAWTVKAHDWVSGLLDKAGPAAG